MTTPSSKVIIRDLGLQDYLPVWQAMQDFTAQRDEYCNDELWCLEHPPVFTQGLNGKDKHLLNVDKIPVINIDRGGQVTYHGPGQLVIYTLIDLKQLNISVKNLVYSIEQAIVLLLEKYNIAAHRKDDAPGVYVKAEKIAALGLRIKRNKSYHGLSLNIDMDLMPFNQINPCGYEDLRVTQLKDLNPELNLEIVKQELSQLLAQQLGYSDITTARGFKTKK